MSPRRRGEPHAAPEAERSSAHLLGILDTMTARLEATVAALEADETRQTRQEEAAQPDDGEEPHR